MSHSKPFFDPVHASWTTELFGLPCGIADPDAVREAESAQDHAALGQAYTKQLRYREAALAYTRELDTRGESLPVLRQRAGKYLATFQLPEARRDLLRCAELGGEKVDLGYRLGLCEYYAGNYEEAMEYFSRTFPLANEEMGIAIVFWHTMSAYRLDAEPALLKEYYTGMQVGHHTGYEKAVRLCAGKESLANALVGLCAEREDLEFSLVAYGIARYLLHQGMTDAGERLLELIRQRDSFWISFGFLAAVNDAYGGTGRLQ